MWLCKSLFVLIFAGCAQLSGSLKQAGFSVLPIDHKHGKLLKAKLMILDLTKQCDVDVLFNVLQLQTLLTVIVHRCVELEAGPEKSHGRLAWNTSVQSR